MGEGHVTEDNVEATEAWNGPLFDVWLKFRPVVTNGIKPHSDNALAAHPPRPGSRVVDLGCGLGETTMQIAGLVGPEGSAHGVDTGERFIETARREAEEAGVENLTYEVMDIETGRFSETYDYAFSRMGVMFFANPVAALRNVRSALVAGGMLNVVVWRRKLDNEWFYVSEQVVEKYLEEPEETDEPTCGPGPFSMANADTVSDILRHAGFEQIELRRSDELYRVGNDIDAALDLTMSLGPAGEIIRLAGDEADKVRPKIRAELADAFQPFVKEHGIASPSSTWIISAINPGD